MSPPPITVYRTAQALFAQRGEDCFQLSETNIDALFTAPDPPTWLQEQLTSAKPVLVPDELLAPIGNQEVWAAGVTYLRSRDARMEAKEKGGGVLIAFTKQSVRKLLQGDAAPRGWAAWTCACGAIRVNVRPKSRWRSVARTAFSDTAIGNDSDSRDIGEENPLYLPQAKSVRRLLRARTPALSCAVRCRDTEIQIHIWRADARFFPENLARK
jgi:2-dehydro-3-deoxy-D-arabinonate dehydratase